MNAQDRHKNTHTHIHSLNNSNLCALRTYSDTDSDWASDVAYELQIYIRIQDIRKWMPILYAIQQNQCKIPELNGNLCIVCTLNNLSGNGKYAFC